MAPSKSTRKGPRRPKKGRSRKGNGLTWKVAGAIAAVALFVFGAVALLHVWRPAERRATVVERPKSPIREPASAERTRIPEKRPATRPVPERPTTPQPPVYEIFPERPPAPSPTESETLHAALPPTPPVLPPVKKRPRLAIIIDDLGYDRPLAEKFIGLKAPLTLAILPHSPYQEAIARLAKEHGREIMLHLPMEPIEFPQVNPGPGALLAAMGPDELLAVLERELVASKFDMKQVFRTILNSSTYQLSSIPAAWQNEVRAAPGINDVALPPHSDISRCRQRVNPTMPSLAAV